MLEKPPWGSGYGMREAGWGRILNMSSVAAQIGGIVGPHYSASKAGLIGFTHWLAAYFAKQNITANALAPALVESDMVTADLRARPDRIPIGRFGTPEELAELAVVVLATLPILVVYPFLQRYFTQGVLAGAIKG